MAMHTCNPSALGAEADSQITLASQPRSINELQFGETVSQNLKWRAITKDTQHQTLAAIHICNMCIRVLLYTNLHEQPPYSFFSIQRYDSTCTLALYSVNLLNSLLGPKKMQDFPGARGTHITYIFLFLLQYQKHKFFFSRRLRRKLLALIQIMSLIYLIILSK